MIKVTHFHRKRRANGNHSFEGYFKAIRELQPKDFQIIPYIFKNESKGIFKRILIILEAFKNKNQINHNTGDIHFANYFLSKKSNLLTIHDCGLLERTKGFKQKIIKLFWFTIPALKSNYITVNSNFTKQNLLSHINFPEEKIIPIYIFVPQIHKRLDKPFNKINPTILQIGTAVNKNIIRTAEALNGIKCTLIILGKLDERTKEVLKKNNINYTNISSSVSDEEVANLYQKCDIVSFPSTFEGFGMPIVEANLTGRVVIAGNTSSMPEIGKNAAIFVDPFDINSIREGFLKAINDDNLRNHLIVNGFENAKRFDRKVIAEQYFDLYRKMAK